jgi:hypothetical protein
MVRTHVGAGSPLPYFDTGFCHPLWQDFSVLDNETKQVVT